MKTYHSVYCNIKPFRYCLRCAYIFTYMYMYFPLGDKRREELLMQEWFGILNRKNKLIKQQINLNILYVRNAHMFSWSWWIFLKWQGRRSRSQAIFLKKRIAISRGPTRYKPQFVITDSRCKNRVFFLVTLKFTCTCNMGN